MRSGDDVPSTRRLSRESGRFVRSTPGSRSLARGLQLLRTFRIGTSALTNAELADRTGLARPTVSRLTRTLVDNGFLQYDTGQQAYRLSAVALSLGLAFRLQVPLLDVAAGLLAQAAREERVNVGLSVADVDEMVIVEFVRGSAGSARRVVVPGARVPLTGSSAGWAWLGGLPEREREEQLAWLAGRHGTAWDALHAEMGTAFHAVATQGFCIVQRPDGPVGLSAPVRSRQVPGCVVSFAIPLATQSAEELAARHGPALLRLAARLERADEALEPL
ncbi:MULTISPECIES: IclR family transcriptional regulator [unclassified Paraburkholderia]|uniref:IclR family transcriptional regulator n=1 Tax=unclassified Paraburkholderia TaxID=2615204 RepID=UPI002AB601E1|nr:MULTISPECIES: helix-turn-helix domain-containing protein [unclassified Paraburkholderia]